MFLVVQAGEDLCLPLEPRKPIRISCKRVGQDLERHLAVQLGIGGLIDLPHPPFADKGGHAVMGDAVTDGQDHDWCRLARFGAHLSEHSPRVHFSSALQLQGQTGLAQESG